MGVNVGSTMVASDSTHTDQRWGDNSRMRIVDLFAGCGGFSLGAHQSDFDVIAAYDNDEILTSSSWYNFPKTKLYIKDVCELSGADVIAAAEGTVDGVIGGPPCQGFSDIGKRQPEDPRSRLLGEYFRIVHEVRPHFFVMENVRGLGYSNARGVLEGALELVVGDYSVFGPVLLNSADFGAATSRPRLFVVGIHKDHGDSMSMRDLEVRMGPAASVREAIGDLEGAVEVRAENGLDFWRITRRGRPFEYARRLRTRSGLFTGHRKTNHSRAVIDRFESVEPGGVDVVGRHPRLEWEGQCPTLRAGTGPDKGSHQSIRPIHPEHARVITVREAARLQGFPDGHRFHSTVWHSFRMIGNSVSPLMAKVLLSAVREKMSNGSG